VQEHQRRPICLAAGDHEGFAMAGGELYIVLGSGHPSSTWDLRGCLGLRAVILRRQSGQAARVVLGRKKPISSIARARAACPQASYALFEMIPKIIPSLTTKPIAASDE
jgi:hypothetical protein